MKHEKGKNIEKIAKMRKKQKMKKIQYFICRNRSGDYLRTGAMSASTVDT